MARITVTVGLTSAVAYLDGVAQELSRALAAAGAAGLPPAVRWAMIDHAMRRADQELYAAVRQGEQDQAERVGGAEAAWRYLHPSDNDRTRR